jgi:hypothetical protein
MQAHQKARVCAKVLREAPRSHFPVLHFPVGQALNRKMEDRKMAAPVHNSSRWQNYSGQIKPQIV